MSVRGNKQKFSFSGWARKSKRALDSEKKNILNRSDHPPSPWGKLRHDCLSTDALVFRSGSRHTQ